MDMCPAVELCVCCSLEVMGEREVDIFEMHFYKSPWHQRFCREGSHNVLPSLPYFLSFLVRNVNKITKAPETISKIMKRLQTAKTSGEEIWKRYVIPFPYGVSIPALASGLHIGFMGSHFDPVWATSKFSVRYSHTWLLTDRSSHCMLGISYNCFFLPFSS